MTGPATPLHKRSDPPFDVRPDDPRLPAARVHVAKRLGYMATGLNDQEFDALVNDVARFQLRWFPESVTTRDD